MDYREFARRGITLLGRTESFRDGILGFAADLPANLRRGDAKLMAMLDLADAWAARNGLDLPPDPGHQALCDAEQAHMIAAITQNLDLTRHMSDAVASLRICLAADESIRLGRVIDL